MLTNALHLTWTTPIFMFLILLPVSSWGLEMQFVPTSIVVHVGEDAKIPCNFHKKNNENVEICWALYHKVVNQTTNLSSWEKKRLPDNTHILNIRNVEKSDSGLYQCTVKVGNIAKTSCGTYLRVKDPSGFLLFNVAETTKNRLITAEGIILLLCAIIPGTFLLYRRCQQAEAHKRIWEAYSTASKAISNDYMPLKTVKLLAIRRGTYHNVEQRRSNIAPEAL